VDETEWLAKRFEVHRPRLRAVAYRMLGSLTKADAEATRLVGPELAG
jgi:DNA-directed RNA polymerase specialized sigma24 family protein